ncbi:MAG: HisA/HisF-related TIM barrel protein, partial [Clostridia bacterium]|nr:HisA/HisF-related TIM barrel protein [Clostridia bacterium]
MKLFPAVDILDGKAVRLLEGKRDKVTVYGDPLDMARKWADMGAGYIHIVDL